MSKEETIEMQGEILETLPNATFRVNWKMAMWYWVIFLEKCVCTIFAFCLVIR